MANEPTITIVGNLTADPELRFTPSGAAVANFTVAVTPRIKRGDEWEDGDAAFYNCAVWRDYAEHVAESLQKGQRVVVVGRLTPRPFEYRDGGKGLSLDVAVDEVGHSLRFGSAKFARGQGSGQGQERRGGSRGNSGQGRPSGGSQRPQGRRNDSYGGDDPWAQGGGGYNDARGGDPRGRDPWASSAGEEPPF